MEAFIWPKPRTSKHNLTVHYYVDLQGNEDINFKDNNLITFMLLQLTNSSAIINSFAVKI